MSRFKIGDRVVAKHRLETFRIVPGDIPGNDFSITEINANRGDSGIIIAIDPSGEGRTDYYHAEFFWPDGTRHEFSTDVHEDSLDPCPQS